MSRVKHKHSLISSVAFGREAIDLFIPRLSSIISCTANMVPALGLRGATSITAPLTAHSSLCFLESLPPAIELAQLLPGEPFAVAGFLPLLSDVCTLAAIVEVASLLSGGTVTDSEVLAQAGCGRGGVHAATNLDGLVLKAICEGVDSSDVVVGHCVFDTQADSSWIYPGWYRIAGVLDLVL